MKSGKYTHIAVALLTSILLIVITNFAIRYIRAYEKVNVSNHIASRLDSISGLVNLWSDDFRSGVELLAEDPKLIELLDNYLQQKTGAEETNQLLAQWFRPIYLNRGYDGHSIITPDFTVTFASSPAYVGKQVASPVSQQAIRTAFAKGSAIGHISESVYAVRNVDGTDYSDTIFQLGCARIEKDNQTLAVLCLRQNPYHHFFAILSTGFAGATGEAYAFNTEGKIISPTRFNNNTGIPEFNKQLEAKAPVKTYGRRLNNQSIDKHFTKAVALAISQGASGYIEGYADYRGIEVVGAAKWIEDLQMGIVVEQDVQEVYGPYHSSKRAIIFLAAIAILLINILSYALFYSRKNLALREERMRAFLNHFPGIIHMRDPDGRFLIANKMATELVDLPMNKVIGTTGEHIPLPKNFLDKMLREHEQVIKTGKPTSTIEKADSVFRMNYEWIRIIRFPVYDPDHASIIAVGTIMQDMTEQVRSAEELQEIRLNLEKIVAQRTEQLELAKIEAEQAAKTKANFMANMSHELRTPMNAIIGLSHLASLVSDDPKLHGYLQRIHQSSNHLLSIINDVLDFSKIEAGKMSIENKEFSLDDLLDKVVSLVAHKAFEKNLEFIVYIDKSLPLFFKGDSLRIGQILINFCSNAIKFTNQGHVSIHVSCESQNDEECKLLFAVKDTGIGIPPEGLAQLFTPFHQLDTSLTRQYEGTGLGLAISKNLVEQMGGTIRVESQENIGSCFSISLTCKTIVNNPGFYEDSRIKHFAKRNALIICEDTSLRNNLTELLNNLSIDHLTINPTNAELCSLNSLNPVDFVLVNEISDHKRLISIAKQLSRVNYAEKPKAILLAKQKHWNDAELDSYFDLILCKPLLPQQLIEAITGIIEPASTEKNAFDLSQYAHLASMSLLLVDDKTINQDVVRELLGMLNIQIDVCHTGFEALQRLSQRNYDVVLMDVQMPGIDGYETTRRIREELQLTQLPIIAMTANALDGDREKCLAVGMNDYLSKPVIPQILFQTLHNWYQNTAPVQALIQPQHKMDEQDSLRIKKLAAIAGLDVKTAVERLLNNTGFYCQLAEKFTQERASLYADIQALLQAGDAETAARQLHSFKSLAATLGAQTLQNKALELETLMDQGLFDANKLQLLDEELQSLIEQIKSALAP